MDKDIRNKDVEGASSDEEEDFESADEGEEGAKSSKPPLATSAGIECANSTSKELVGKNDTSTKTPVTSGDGINLKTAEVENQTPKMDENVTREKEVGETHGEDIPCRVTESSPCSEQSEQDAETSHETLVVEDTNRISPKLSDDKTKAAESQKDNDEKIQNETAEAGKQEESGQGKSTAMDSELGAEESTVPKDNRGQREASASLGEGPRKDSVESSCDNMKPDR